MDANYGIVLFAHGSRDPLWHAPIEAVAARIRALDAKVPVRCAYLELTRPDLPTAVAELVAAGVRHVRILPMFLGMGRHAREDLPALVQALCHAHPDVEVVLLPPVGEDRQLTNLMAQIALGTPSAS